MIKPIKWEWYSAIFIDWCLVQLSSERLSQETDGKRCRDLQTLGEAWEILRNREKKGCRNKECQNNTRNPTESTNWIHRDLQRLIREPGSLHVWILISAYMSQLCSLVFLWDSQQEEKGCLWLICLLFGTHFSILHTGLPYQVLIPGKVSSLKVVCLISMKSLCFLNRNGGGVDGCKGRVDCSEGRLMEGTGRGGKNRSCLDVLVILITINN